jgi:hypothetical protein
MKEVRSSETSVHFNVTTRRYIQEDSKHHNCRSENLKYFHNLLQFIIHFPLSCYTLYFNLVLLCTEVSKLHTIRRTVGLLWTSDKPVVEPLPTQYNTTYKHKTQTSMPSARFKLAITATKRPHTRLRTRSHWDRLIIHSPIYYLRYVT